MNLSEFRAANPRAIALALAAALALFLGFGCFSAEQSLHLVINGGYWAMLAITLLWGRSLWRVWRADWPGWTTVREFKRWPAAVVAGGSALLLAHETFGFKILMDEAMLLGTSMSMHYDKTAVVPLRGHDIQGAFQLLAGQLDKRPLFQPFLVSVLHDLTGYRPENAFVLNAVLAVVFLVLAYRVGRMIGGPAAGAVAVLLLTGLPLLAQNATGGGFELLNLVLILAVLLLAARYLEKRDVPGLEALGLTAILLAQTRYESALFLLPVGMAVLWVWWQDRRPAPTWVVSAMPLMLVPVALHNKVFSVRQSAWEMASQPGFDRPFAFSYVPDNIAHALNFFFNTTGEQSNSLALSWFGFLALPFFILWLAKVFMRLRSARAAEAALAFMGLGLVLHTLLLMCYFWGKFDDPVIRRLSLPLHLLLVLAVLTVAAELDRQGRVWRILGAVAAAGLFAFSLPSMARHDYSLQYYVGREMEWRREFIARHPERDYLFIDNNSIMWITHLVSSTPVKQALDHKGNIVFNLRNRIFGAIYVFQRYTVEPKNGALILPVEDDLGPDYQLETVWERRFTPLTVSRISRVTSIREGPTSIPAGPPRSLEGMTPDEQEKARAKYLENFIKRLP